MAREFARAFYQSKQWKQTSGAYMATQNFVCERCGGVGVICHHKKYLNPTNIHDPNIALGWDNLECLCQECHNAEHMLKRNKIEFDDNGDIATVKDNGAIKEWKKQKHLIDDLLLEMGALRGYPEETDVTE